MMPVEDDSEPAHLLKLLAFQRQHADTVLDRYKVRPDLTIEELAQVVLYLSDRLTEEQQQRRSLESQLQELKHLVDLLKPNPLKTYGSGT
jgi:ABC-type lipoprotein export system ATPase subunit